MNTILTLICAAALLTGAAACNKTHKCYDASIVHDGACPTHCPGVVGCDGKTYCNDCEAARHGIRPR